MNNFLAQKVSEGMEGSQRNNQGGFGGQSPLMEIVSPGFAGRAGRIAQQFISARFLWL